jgi:GT2 family glycosyltransferase
VPRLSVVIPTFRRPDALPRTLAALERQTVPPGDFEVLVVDDPVEDDAAAVAASVAAARRPYAVEHLHRGARGVSAARNAGWRAARAELVLFLGDDILADPSLLAEHLAWHERRPEETAGVLGAVRWADGLRVTPFMRWLERGVQFDYASIPGEEASWAHFYTANVSVKRALLERAGGFDEAGFPFLYEDLELGRRLADHGLRLFYNRRASAGHLHASDVEDWRRRMAATAEAERRWVARRPEMPAWFHDRFAAAAARPRVPAAAGRLAARVPPGAPVVGRAAAAVADLHFRQQLAPAFLAAWEAGG